MQLAVACNIEVEVLVRHVCYPDVRDHASYPAVVDWVGSLLEGEGLNVLVNNAAVAHWHGFDDVTRDFMLDCLESNCVAPLMMAKVAYALHTGVGTVFYRNSAHCGKRPSSFFNPPLWSESSDVFPPTKSTDISWQAKFCFLQARSAEQP